MGMDECARMACGKDAVALLTFSPPQAKAWLYDLIDANPATGIMLCRKHANATVVPMSWQLVDSRDPSWSPPGEPAAPQPEPAAIPGLLAEDAALTEPYVETVVVREAAASHDTPSYDTPSYDTPSYDTPSYDTPSYDTPAASYEAAPEPAMATILSTTVQRTPQPAQPPAAVIPTVTAPSSAAAMPASPIAGTAAAAVVAPPMPDPRLDPPVARTRRRAETIRIEAHPGERVSHVVSLNDQIAAYGRQVEPQPQWVEPQAEAAPPAAADLVANLQERLLPDPSLFELPLDAPAVTPHHGYR